MIFREMSRLSDVEDSILVSQTIISQQTGVLFKINQNQFPMVISFNFKKKKINVDNQEIMIEDMVKLLCIFWINYEIIFKF